MEPWREELYHHGIKGMHWGVRRFQNPDGSLTSAGRRRYEKEDMARISKELKAKGSSDAYKLSENYVRNQVLGTAITTGVMIAPVAAMLAYVDSGSGKSALAAALASIGGMSVAALASSNRKQKSTYKKYKEG